MNAEVALAAALAAIACVVTPFAVRPWLIRRQVWDAPNARSSHSQTTLRGGGLAPLTGIIVGLTAYSLLESAAPDREVIWIIALASVGAAALGLVEDVKGLRVLVRALIQLVLGLASTLALWSALGGDWFLLPLGALFIAAYINAANFMDGINGISGLHGGAVGVSLFVVGLVVGEGWLAVSGLVVAGAFLAFLPWNFRRPGMFLGDVGSYLLGASLAVVAVAAAFAGVPIIAVVAPMSIYLADTGYTLITRILRGERWHEAHRVHVYQRLTDLGNSHLTVALYVTALSLVNAAFGVLYLSADGWLRAVFFVLIGAVMTLYATSPRWIVKLK